MLTAAQRKTIDSKWNPTRWPTGPAYDYARAMHRRSYQFYCDRIQHLGFGGGAVLEAGCGTGTWCFALLTAFDKVAGVDFTQERIDVANWLKARFRLKKPEFRKGDIRAISFENETFDAVFCSSVLLGGVPLEKAYAEFHRVLKPGGVAYVELNGLGYGYSLFRETGPRHEIGGHTIYNSLCQRRLSRTVAQIRAASTAHATAFESAGAASDLLKAVGAEPDAVAAAEAIEALGDGYPALLLKDVRDIGQGTRDKFSQPSGGRGYEPEELEAVARQTGFRRFEWSHEGWLSLQDDGTVRKGTSAVAPPFSQPFFEGHLRRFETLSWK